MAHRPAGGLPWWDGGGLLANAIQGNLMLGVISLENIILSIFMNKSSGHCYNTCTFFLVFFWGHVLLEISLYTDAHLVCFLSICATVANSSVTFLHTIIRDQANQIITNINIQRLFNFIFLFIKVHYLYKRLCLCSATIQQRELTQLALVGLE
ncbi:hypothetical protein ACJX0J_030308 [Zea mays]